MPTVNVIALTVFCSLALAIFFLVLFIGNWFGSRTRSVEQDALLPLDEEPRNPHAPKP